MKRKPRPTPPLVYRGAAGPEPGGLAAFAGEVPPPAGVRYPQILRGATYAWWRSALGVVLAVSLFVLTTQVVASAVIAVGYAVDRPPGSLAAYTAAGYRFEHPVGMLAQNLAIAALIPLSWFLITVVHRVRPRWLSSVQPRLRWRYLLVCAGAAIIILNGVVIVSKLAASGPGLAPQAGVAGFIAVIILTSPLQAAAEEYLFRGYLLQALGSLAANPWFGVVASSLLFALFHGGQNLPLFLNRLGFGLLAAILVLKTGGLEAGIGAHIVNNLSAYSWAALTSTVADLRAVRDIGWLDSGLGLVGFALFTLAALLLAKGLRLRTHTPATGLETAR